MNLTQRINPRRLVYGSLLSLILLSPFWLMSSAAAHHPSGGQTPDTLLSGVLSGLGHPVIGLDHLTFVIASGLVAIGLRWGILIPIGFLVTALIGTGLHLMGQNMPQLEMAIASSVILFGLILGLRKRDVSRLPAFENTAIVGALAAIAGLFHGYAYGEAIIGAEMTPLLAYLTGFTLMQGSLALFAYFMGKALFSLWTPLVQYFGFAIGAIGLVFLSQAI